MKRDMDLVRAILLLVDERDETSTDDIIRMLDYDLSKQKLIAYHLKLLVKEASFLTGYHVVIDDVELWENLNLTWIGHDFLDSIRDPEVWQKTKDGASAVKNWSIDTFKEIAKGLVKKQIEEWSGVKVS